MSKSSMIEEMRQYTRHPTNIPIKYSVAGTPVVGGEPRMHNASKNGLSFTTSARNLAPGSMIQLKIPLNGEIFEVAGVVMWSLDMDDRYEMGVKLGDDNKEWIDKFDINFPE